MRALNFSSISERPQLQLLVWSCSIVSSMILRGGFVCWSWHASWVPFSQ